MTNCIEVYEYDSAYVQIVAERGLLAELGEYFTFFAKNYTFMPAFRDGRWDGKIRLLDYTRNLLYRGLIPYIQKFCVDRGYEFENHIEEVQTGFFDVDKFLSDINPSMQAYDYQKEAIQYCINNSRALLLSPTSSGKSFITYCLVRYVLESYDKKILITVPMESLVTQLYNDFESYSNGWDVSEFVDTIYSTKGKMTNKRVFISTWQSVYKKKRSFFEQFDAIIVDEAHGAKAEALKGILEKAGETEFRIGLTGTLDGFECNKLIIEGLTGVAKVVTDTATLMEKGVVSQLKINALIINHTVDDTTYKKVKKDYNSEVDFIVENKKRNSFICNLAEQRANIHKENTLILSAYIDHCKELCRLLEKRKVKYYLFIGNTDRKEKEEIRKLTEKENGVVIVATIGAFSTGISIKNLQNLILATNTKSLIKILQIIGRILRLDGKTNTSTLYDIVDKISTIKNTHQTYSVKHFLERVAIYTKQKFRFKTHNINM